jgi:6-phosphofructokinase 1
MHLGGTILGTTNRGHFVPRTAGCAKVAIPPLVIEQARMTLKDLSIEALIVVGGDGSLSSALQLHNHGLPIVAVPKTIDNDLDATDMTFGFDSAVACVADALDRLHTTATSHRRVMVLEVMGRLAGWIALYGGLAGGADIILIPEIPFSFEAVAAAVRAREAEGCLSTMIVAAEGAKLRNPNAWRGRGDNRRRNIAEIVAREIGVQTGKDTRTCVLGHLQRGGAPTVLDRILGTGFGVKAVELVADSKFGQMVSYRNYELQSVSIAEAVNRMRLVPPDGQMVRTARAVGVTFGD